MFFIFRKYIRYKAVRFSFYSFPAIRDPDGNIYIREFNGGFLCGGFEKWAKPSFEKELPGKSHQENYIEKQEVDSQCVDHDSAHARD